MRRRRNWDFEDMGLTGESSRILRKIRGGWGGGGYERRK